MARILPPSVFRANFEAAEFKPTQSQRVGERFATPEGLKVGVDVVDRVGGTISDAVSRFSRGRATLARARARKKDPLGKDKGLLGYWTLSPEEQAELERQSYGAGQATVVGAKDRVFRNEKGQLVRRSGTDERAAGYDAMRSAWDRPGSGRLLSDPARDPSRLVSEDYKRLASASPLPKAGAAPKPYRPMLDDVRSRHKANKPVVDDMNTAILVREGIAKNPVLSKGFDIDNLTDKQAQALVNASSGKLRLLRDDSGDKSVYTVQVAPTREDEVAMATAKAEGRQSEADNIRDSLRARGRALLGLLNDPNLDQASTDLNKYSMLLDQWRSIVAANPQDPRAAAKLKELESYSGHIAQASGDLPTYLRNYGVRASEAQVAADKRASDEVGEKRERLDEINRKSQVASLTSSETNEKIRLIKEIRQKGGELPASVSSTEDRLFTDPGDGIPMTPAAPHDATTIATEDDQQDAWERAKNASGLTADPESAPRVESREFTPGARQVKEPFIAPGTLAAQKMPQDLQIKADRLRRNNVPEEIIAEVIPGYQAARDFRAEPLTFRERLGSAGSNVARDPRLGGNPQGLHPVARRDLARREAAKQRLHSKIQERRETIGPMPDREAYALDRKPERKWTPDYRAPAPARSTGPRPLVAKKDVAFDKFDLLLKKHGTESGLGERKRIYNDYKRGEYFEPNKVKFPNKKEKERLKQIVIKAAKKNKVEPWLMLALVAKESGFRPTVISNSNALGIAQTIPSTFRSVMGKDVSLDKVFDPEIGAEAGARYLAQNIKKYAKKGRSRKEQLQMTLAAYNAGPTKLKEFGLKLLLSDRWAKIKSGDNKGKGATRLYVEGILANMPKEKAPKVAVKKKKS